MTYSSNKVFNLLKEHQELMESFNKEQDTSTETYSNLQNKAPSQVLELDLHLKPVGNVGGALALLFDGKWHIQ